MSQPADKPSIQRILDLQQLLLLFAQIQRQCERRHAEGYQYENDTEHSYNLAMTAWFLAPHFPELNRDVLICIALAHDILEVHAGDTDVYADEARLATKPAREAAAVQQLEQDWSDFPELLDAIRLYEAREAAEARFIYALDKIMPIMLIFISNGHTWQRKGVTPEKLDGVKQGKVDVSPEIKPYYDALFALLLEHRDLFATA